MMSVDYHGRVFDEHTDWISYVRDVLSGRTTAGLREDVPDVNSGLAQLAEDLRGSGLKDAYCDALLTILETGSSSERDRVRNLPYEEAPGAADRILALLESERDAFRRDGWIGSLLAHVLQLRAEDARAHEIVREEATHSAPTSGVLELAAKYESEWFNAKLPNLELVPNGQQILRWLMVTKDRRGLMDALVACGPSFIEALARRIHESGMPPSAGEQFRGDFAKHPAFASILK